MKKNKKYGFQIGYREIQTQKEIIDGAIISYLRTLTPEEVDDVMKKVEAKQITYHKTRARLYCVIG